MTKHDAIANDQDPGRAALADALRVSFRLLIVTMLLLGAAYLLSGIYIVQEHQRAYVLVFGRITGVGDERVKGPGLHWTWPKPIAEIIRVPAERIHSIEIDTLWHHDTTRGDRAHMRPRSPALRPGIDGYTLTGDANILHSQWAVRYTLRDPETYLFRIADAEDVLRKELDRAATRISHQWAVDAALRTDIESFRQDVDRELRSRLHELDLGLQLHRLDLLSVTPPRQVASAFESVIEAEQDRSRLVSAARAHAARVHNETKGETSRIAAEARAERQRIVSEAEADADFFRAVLQEFRDNPEVITATLWQNRIRTVLQKADAQYVVHERDDGMQELRLLIPSPR